jgi:hypothetical protein
VRGREILERLVAEVLAAASPTPLERLLADSVGLEGKSQVGHCIQGEE